MSDPGALGAEKNQTDASSSLLPEGLPSFEEVTRSMQVIHQSPCRNQNLKRSCLVPTYKSRDEVDGYRTSLNGKLKLGRVPLCPNRCANPLRYPHQCAHPQLWCPNLCAHPPCPNLVLRLYVNLESCHNVEERLWCDSLDVRRILESPHSVPCQR